MKADHILLMAEVFRAVNGYYPNAQQWNEYALQNGLMTTPEVYAKLRKRWDDIMADREAERAGRVRENEMKTAEVLKTEMGLLRYLEEQMSFPSPAEWDAYAAENELLQVGRLQRGSIGWWRTWSDRYGSKERAERIRGGRGRRKAPGAANDGQASRPLTADRALDCLRQAYNEIGSGMKQRDYNQYARQHGLPEFSRIRQFFWHVSNPWETALAKAGIPAPVKRTLTREDAVAALREASEHLGTTFTQQQYMLFRSTRPELPMLPKLLKLFQNEEKPWESAMRAAGLEPARVGKRRQV